MEYLVRPGNIPHKYEVHKFDGNETPEATYNVFAMDGKLSCNCPSGHYRGYCCHKDFVKDYRRKERAGFNLIDNPPIYKKDK